MQRIKAAKKSKKRDALKKLRKLSDKLIIIIPGDSLPPFNTVPYPWNSSFQIVCQFRERYAQFWDRPKAKQTLDLDVSLFVTFCENVIRVHFANHTNSLSYPIQIIAATH